MSYDDTAVCRFCFAVPFGGEIQVRALQQMLSFLYNRYPKVRTMAAEQLYTCLQTYEEDLLHKDHVDDALAVITDTPWGGRDSDLIKERRNSLYPLLQVPQPVAKAAGASTGASSSRPSRSGAASGSSYSGGHHLSPHVLYSYV